MAKWRALHGDISRSEQVDELTEFEQLLFTWMIPHADDWGVLTGKARQIKLTVIPGSDRTSQDITGALRHMQEVGLIWYYESDTDGPLVQFRGWDDRQPIRKDRRADPRLPLYEGQASCQDKPGKARTSRAKTGKTILDKTIPDKKPSKGTRKRDPLLDHWAIKCYKHVARRHVDTVLRGDWVAFAEKFYKSDDDSNFDAMKVDLKKFVDMGYYKGNTAWFKEWVEKGKPEKWERGTHKQGQDTDNLPYDDVAAERQEARRLHAAPAGDSEGQDLRHV